MDEGRDLGEEQHAPSASNSAVPASEKRPKLASAKVRENAEVLLHPKAFLWGIHMLCSRWLGK